MEMMLAENIRMYRKKKRLTQEQLAADLGVTSAVSYTHLTLPTTSRV